MPDARYWIPDDRYQMPDEAGIGRQGKESGKQSGMEHGARSMALGARSKELGVSEAEKGRIGEWAKWRIGEVILGLGFRIGDCGFERGERAESGRIGFAICQWSDNQMTTE